MKYRGYYQRRLPDGKKYSGQFTIVAARPSEAAKEVNKRIAAANKADPKTAHRLIGLCRVQTIRVVIVKEKLTPIAFS